MPSRPPSTGGRAIASPLFLLHPASDLRLAPAYSLDEERSTTRYSADRTIHRTSPLDDDRLAGRLGPVCVVAGFLLRRRDSLSTVFTSYSSL